MAVRAGGAVPRFGIGIGRAVGPSPWSARIFSPNFLSPAAAMAALLLLQ
jgi:hypothetical protein